ncbi:MAG: Nif3-like dinuclear metal center hexameric protein [Eggerthellaceae bacterium]|jgi:putative NIF3 family GTP cyclohydrolase 1 type 2|nr:Nif3-like dinuclear metal center hexameric protein [Eggerthellaceae bacterium]MDR2721895.1 Nif3-like dinuclear metal center hexameric protein [Coriobacteriaceae bacterium]
MSATKHSSGKASLVKSALSTLSKQGKPLSVRALEQHLLSRFPAGDGQDWDRNGLLVGDPSAEITRVAVALDPTVKAIKQAKMLGAQVLVTHHPAYLNPPEVFYPAESVAINAGAGVFAAIEEGVALMSFHTALDVSREAASVLPKMLSLDFLEILDRLDSDKNKGYGQLCTPKEKDAGLTLGQLAARCTAVFGRQPRVWGDFSQVLGTIVTATGSAGDLTGKCLARFVDCLICGEVRYHDAQAAKDAGLALIDLGHDTSEAPLCAVLVAAIEASGFPKDSILLIDQSDNWTYPETVRL